MYCNLKEWKKLLLSVNGDIEANNFSSCYIDYLTNLIEKNPGASEIVLWSDGCTYQNRCNVLSNALLTFAVQNKVDIFQKYLEVGHTHMECDSVHSNIERSLKNTNINLPTDYIQLIQSARKSSPGKYGVKYLDYTFFKNFKDACSIKTIKPSKEVGRPYVTDIRQLWYGLDGVMKFNLGYDDKWENFPQKISISYRTPQQLYHSPLKISHTKYVHLQELKSTIPKDAHFFYDNLDHHEKMLKEKR